MIELPDKYDIIPIHTSDRAQFKRCRRKWNWSSPSRHNLVRRPDIFGVNIPLWFGTGIHYALEKYYDPTLRHDPVESFLTWYNVTYHGGVVTPELAKISYDPAPKPLIQHTSEVSVPNMTTAPVYKVQGLNVLLPYEDHTELEEHRELGVNMMKFYKYYAEQNDDFVVLATEGDFSVPIWDIDNDCILKHVDVREESPNYGKELVVHYRGRRDALCFRESNETYFIIEHKTNSRIHEDHFATLECNEQVTSYLWASEVEAMYYDLPWKGKRFTEVIYQALRKNYPKPPTILNDGKFSINRQTESPTYGMMQQLIAEIPWWELLIETEPKYKAYMDFLKEAGDERFIVRKSVPRNRPQIVSAGNRIYLEAKDMLNNPSIYPSMSGEYHCIHCEFRVPCIAVEDGIDVEPMLRNDYFTNKDR